MASLSDIAASAEVSISTVRRVLYDLGPVRPSTRQRVLLAAADLAYVPNPYARALVGAKAPIVALVVPQLTWHVSNIVVVTLHQQIATLGLHSVFFVGGGSAPEQTVAEMAMLSPQAVVLVQVTFSEQYRQLADRGIPVFGIDVRGDLPAGAPFDAVGLDRAGGFCRATQHLLQLGHRRIGLLDSSGATGRQEGYSRALEAAGVDFRAVAVADAQGRAALPIRLALEQLLHHHPDLTGLVCTTDLWAQEALYHLADMGLRVPQDVSLTGYSNEPWTRWTTPALTTLDQGTGELCRHTLGLLKRRLEGSTEPWSRRVIVPELVARDSTAPPRAMLPEAGEGALP